MSSLNLLKTTLLDLARAVEGDDIPLTIGGGFGLYLQQEALRETGARTLFDQLPEPRTTNDIDLFIRVEVLARPDAIQILQQRIEQSGFVPLESAKYFQWRKGVDTPLEVKLDLLCGPLGLFSPQLHTNSLPRVRPKGPKQTMRLHAHLTDEAIDVDEHSTELIIEAVCSDGVPHSATVYIPQAFTYLMMKLFAFDDRQQDQRKDVGRHHAMDLYRIVGMLTEPEYQQTLKLGSAHRADERVVRARNIVADSFAGPSSLGMLRIREHALFRETFAVDEFRSVLAEVFAA